MCSEGNLPPDLASDATSWLALKRLVKRDQTTFEGPSPGRSLDPPLLEAAGSACCSKPVEGSRTCQCSSSLRTKFLEPLLRLTVVPAIFGVRDGLYMWTWQEVGHGGEKKSFRPDTLHVLVQAHSYTYIYIYICVYDYVYTHADMYVYIHIYILAMAPLGRWSKPDSCCRRTHRKDSRLLRSRTVY